MDVITTPAPTADAEVADVIVQAPEGTPDAIRSIREAARVLASARHKQAPEAPPEAAEPTELPVEDSAAPVEEPTSGETTEEASPPVEEPEPISPPRSWNAEDKESFKSLPRETQARIAEIDRAREKEVRRVQNEVAEERKQYAEKLTQAENMRQQYEQALPQLVQTLQAAQAGEFSDIKTIDDVQRLAREDWARYIQFDAHQKRIAVMQQEIMAAENRKQQEQSQKWNAFASKEDALFAEATPEMSDPDKGKKLMQDALDTLRDRGFSQDELAKIWAGQENISLRDHRMQLLIRDAVKWRQAESKKAQVAKKAPPPVQRPGVAQAPGHAAQVKTENLNKRLTQTGNLRDAVRYLQAKRYGPD